MLNILILGMFLLFHVTSASESTTETDGAWKRMMEKRIDLMLESFTAFTGRFQDMQLEMTELKRRLGVYDENENIPTSRINEGMNEAQMNDTDLEERVTFLEFQMVNVNEELLTVMEYLIDVENGVENVEGQITVILADQVI